MSRLYTIQLERREILLILAALTDYACDDDEATTAINVVDYLLTETGVAS